MIDLRVHPNFFIYAMNKLIPDYQFTYEHKGEDYLIYVEELEYDDYSKYKVQVINRTTKEEFQFNIGFSEDNTWIWENDNEQNMIKYSIHFVYLINNLLQNYYSIYYEE